MRRFLRIPRPIPLGTTVATRAGAPARRLALTSTRFLRTSVCAAVLFSSILTAPIDLSAQRRGNVRAAPRSVVVLGGYYRPFLYDPWYSPFYPYGWFPPYGYAGAYPPDSSLRLQVAPRETEVFVDGYYAGTVDDFDGFLQRLHLEPGEHEITLYLQGHRTARQMIYLQPNGTFRIRHAMETLPPGEAQIPDRSRRRIRRAVPRLLVPGRAQGRERRRLRESPHLPFECSPRTLRCSSTASYGRDLRPTNSSYSKWWQECIASRFVARAIARYSSDVDARAGETERLNVSLSRQ